LYEPKHDINIAIVAICGGSMMTDELFYVILLSFNHIEVPIHKHSAYDIVLNRFDIECHINILNSGIPILINVKIKIFK